MSVALLWLVAMCALAPRAPGSPGALSLSLPSRATVLCTRCEDTGVVVCRACAKTTCTWEGEGKTKARHCAAAAACRECLGMRLVECPDCERAPPADLATRRAESAEWLASMRKIDAVVDGELQHAESEHFRITWNIRQLDVKGATTPHLGMHVYLDRLEALYADFLRDLSATDKDFCGKTHVMLWQKARDQERASLQYTGQTSSTESKLMGKSPVVSIFYDKSFLHEEFELHQAAVHQVAHCLLSNVFDGLWPGNIQGGWIDCGLAHAYEVRYFGSVRHYCYVESDTLMTFQFGRWEQAVLSGVLNGDARPFLGVTGRNTNDLTPEEHMYAWSYCDYLLRAHADKFGAIARAVKGRKATVEILKQSLGETPMQFQESWAKWVKETYSPKKKSR